MRIPLRTSCQRDTLVFIHKEISSPQRRKDAKKHLSYGLIESVIPAKAGIQPVHHQRDTGSLLSQG
jgi:hypothetical protein